MGHDKVKPRYCVFKRNAWVWMPVRRMLKAGFRQIKLGPGYVVEGQRYMSAADIERAMGLNAEWDRYRRGLEPVERRRYATGTVGDAYERSVKLREDERKAKGIKWTVEQHSRDDWPRGWRWLGPLFEHCDPKTVTPEQMLALRTLVAGKVSESEAHRTVKVWRALWRRMAGFGYCNKDMDPSLQFANSAPAPRQAVWSEGEAVRLVKQAWRSGYHGLAALLAVAWDSSLSPVDVRKLTAAQRRQDAKGTWFATDRTKTGRSAFATLSRRAEFVLDGYLTTIGAELVGPIFRNRSGRPYTKDTLGDDFRAVRTMVMGKQDKRQLQDFRRSGTVEALAGKASTTDVSAKMANNLSASNRLHATYAPAQLIQVRDADTARRRGRRRLRDE